MTGNLLLLKIVMSRKSIVVVDVVWVNLMFGCRLLILVRRFSRLNLVGHMRNMSSTYLAINSGFWLVFLKSRCSNTEMNMLATVGENAAPIATPMFCWKQCVLN